MPGGGVGSGGGAHGGAWAQAHDALRVDHLLLGHSAPFRDQALKHTLGQFLGVVAVMAQAKARLTTQRPCQ